MKDDTAPPDNKKHGLDWHRALIEQIDDLITVIDTNGMITYVTPAVTRVLGYEPAELVGHDGYEFVHPEDRELTADAINTVLSNPSTSEVVEVRFRHTDGSWHWIEVAMWNQVDDDTIDGILLSSRDITERKQYEARAEKFAEEYEDLLNNVEDAIFLINVEESDESIRFEFERLSPSYERQTGLTTEEVQGQTPREVFDEQQGSEIEANYQGCVNASEPISYEEELQIDEGARFWQTKLAPVVSDNEITRLIGITRNVTGHVERERQLSEQNKRLDEFTNIVSHDLRNPLTVAQGRATILTEQTENENLDPLLRALDRMEAIVGGTLTLARQGDKISDPEWIDLNNIVRKCWSMVDTEDAAIEIVDTMTFQGDPDRLQQVFENLFQNAVEHGKSDVTVRVGSHNKRGIYVEDDGAGIPVKKRVEVLEPGHSSASGGTGFGLTIVSRVAEAHGWELSITDGTNGGARFEFEMAEQGNLV